MDQLNEKQKRVPIYPAMDQFPTEEELNARRQPRPPKVSVRPHKPRVKSNPLRKWFQRKSKPMSLKAFSVQLGVTPGYISQLCSDSPPWPKRHIARQIGVITRGAVTPNMLAGFSKKLIAEHE